MTKLVLKTVAITLAAILSACLIAFGSLALFAPAKIAGFFDDLGMYKSSIHYYEKQYGKSESIEDLAVLILKIDEERDAEKEEEYLELMLKHPNFLEYCDGESASSIDPSLSMSDFYKGKYAVALIRNNKFDKAVNFASECVFHGYANNNPFSIILLEFGSELTKEQLNTLKTKISDFVGGAYTSVAESDLAIINQLLDNN